jgi:hypothetical protein
LPQNFALFKQLANRPKFAQSGHPGANPTTVSYNASAEKNYKATSSLVRFENKNIFFCIEETL